MDPVNDDRFEVFVRLNRTAGEAEEQPLATCATYAEARLIRRAFHGSPGQFVIRYVGPAGGGD
jgi:hypothetical protein